MSASPIEIAFRQDPALHDGRFANNAWLQELPDPMTTLTWGNAAFLSTATASALGVATGDVVRVALAGQFVDIPALVVPGHADEALSLRFGYGREGGEQVARGVGVNVYPIWTTGTSSVGFGSVTRVLERGTPVRRPLAMTQSHWSLEGRAIIQQATVDEYRRDPEFTARLRRRTLSILRGAAGAR